MSSSTPPLTGPLSRRRLLHTAALAGLVPLTGCQGSPLVTEAGEPATEADPDERLLVAAAGAEAEMVARLRALLPRSPGRVRRTLQVHEAHLELLGEADARLPEPDVGDDRLTLRRVTAAEEALGRRHAAAAVQASSGSFARLLAGMAAAAAQQADLWRSGSGA